jgi:glycosyltransferase involved in cell wall biosynthesis
MPPHRIAYWFEFPTLNGGERSFLAFLDRLDRDAFTAVAVAPTGGALADALRAADVEVHADPGGDAERVRWIEARNIDLLHANSLSMGCRTGPLGRTAGIPAVAHVRDIMRLGARRRDALAANRAIVAVSAAAGRALESEGIPPEIVRVIHNGIDPDGLGTAPDAAIRLRREMHWPAEAPVVINLGQICLRKGQDLFLAAAKRVASVREDVRFLVVGERFSGKAESVAFEEGIRAAAASPALVGRVRLTGWRTDAIDLIAGASVLAHAAHQEPFGRVLLEAQATGTPVVATEVGGSAEIIRHVETGLLVPPADPEALAGAILETLQDPTRAAEFAAAGRARVRARFLPTHCAAAVTALYRTLLPAS